MSDAGMLEPQWFMNVKDEAEFITSKLQLPSHCPATLINLSENMVEGMFVAGGSCITIYDSLHQFTDFDIFVNTKEALVHARQVLDMLGFKPMRQKQQDAFMEYEDGLSKAQIIFSSTIRSLENILSAFDFSCVKIGFDHQRMIEARYTRQDIAAKQIRCNPVSTNPVKLINRLCRYAAKGYHVDVGLIKEIWDRNQKNATVNIKADEAEMARLLEIFKQQQQQIPILQPLQQQPYTYPPLMPITTDKTEELDSPYMNPVYTGQPTKFTWTKGNTGYTVPTCSRCGSKSHNSGDCY